MSNLMNSKSLLAKLMATEDIIVEQRKVSTAYFDLRNRVLCLPILKEDLSDYNYDHFIGHEVGHARYTPADDYREAGKHTVKSVLNVVEDARIERKIKYKYPGLRNSFIRSYTDLIERNFFETKGLDLNKLNFIDRANLYFKGGPAQGIEFTDEERVYLDMMDTTETFPDVVEVTKKIVEFMKEQAHEQIITAEVLVEAPSGKGDPQNKMDVQMEGIESEESEESEEDDGEGQSAELGEQEKDEKPKQEEGEKQAAATVGAGSSDIEELIEQMIQSKTDEAYRENEQQLFDEQAKEHIYCDIPEVDLNRIVIPHSEVYEQMTHELSWLRANEYYSDTAYIKMQRDLNRIVSYMVKEFELRKNAEQMKRAKTAKTGDLDMKRIYAYNFHDDIFKKMTVTPNGKSHGLVLFLDWSGSMKRNIPNTVRQLLALIMFCKKVNIPYEVYAFGDGTKKNVSSYNTVVPKPGELIMNNFILYNIFSSKMSAKEFKFAASVWCTRDPSNLRRYMNMSGTPLNEAIISAMKIVPEFKRKYNLQIVNTVVLTDGESNGNFEYFSKEGRRRSFSKQVTIVRDNKSRIEEKLDEERNTCGVSMTEALLRVLKRKTGCNVIGFYILSLHNFERAHRLYGSNAGTPSKYLESRNIFRETKNLVLKPRGFDEYYLLKDDSISENEGDFEDVEVKSTTTRSIVSAFNKYNKGRLESRVVLNRFIDLIS